MRRFVWLAVVIALVGAVFGDEVVMPKNLPLKVEGSNLVENVMPTLQHHPKFPKAKKSLTTLEYPDCIVDTVGFTYYDMQHNHTIGRNIAVDRAGGVHIAWMRAPDASFTHRHIYYNYITPAGNVIAPASSPIPAEGSNYAGYCTIALAHLPPMFDTTATEIEVPFIAFHAEYSDLPDPHTDVVWDLTYRAGGEGSRGGFAGSESGSPLPIAGSGSLPPIAYSNSNQYDDLIPELEECSDSIDIQAIWPVVETGNDGWAYLASTNSQDTNHVCGTEINQWIVFWSGQPEYDEDGYITYYHFGSPLLLDLQNGINVDLAYDHNSGELAAVYYYYDIFAEPACSDTLSFGYLYDKEALYCRVSTDNGATWSERIPIIQYDGYPTEDQLHQIIRPFAGQTIDSSTGIPETVWVAEVDTYWVAFLPLWAGAVSAVYDDDGVLHVAFEAYILAYKSLEEYESSPCYPAAYYGNAICYWNSRDREVIPVSWFFYGLMSGIMSTDDNSLFSHRHSLDPSISVDDEGNLYIAWDQTFAKQYDFYHSDTFFNWVVAHEGRLSPEDTVEYLNFLASACEMTIGDSVYYFDVSDDGIANEDVYVSMSIDGGRSWGKGYNITQSFSPGCAAGECESELNVSMAERVDDALHIFAVLDLDAGENLREVGERTNNPIIYIKLPKETATFDTILARASAASSGAGPRVTLLEPASGSASSCPDQPIKFLITDSDGVDWSTISLVVNDEEVTTTHSGDTLIYTPTTTYADGETVYFSLEHITDMVGDTSEPVSGYFVVDLSAPYIDVESVFPAEGDTVLVGDVTISLQILDDVSGVAPTSLRMSIDGEPIEASAITTTPIANGISVEVAVVIGDTGTYTVCVDTVTDRARYCGANALEDFCWSFVVSLPETTTSAGPRVTLLEPARGSASSCPDQPIKFLITDSDGVDWSVISLVVNDEEVTTTHSGDTLIYTPATTYADGETVYFSLEHITDMVGDTSEPVSGYFVVDFSAPYIDVESVSPAEGDTVHARDVTISLHILDDVSGVAPTSLRMSIDGEPIGASAITTTPIPNGISVEATVTIEDTGTYTVCVDTVTDRARYCGANALEEEFCWSFVVFPSSAVQESDKHTPDRLTISAVPNPFNASANIIWETTKSGEGRVEIIDLHGKVVATLHSGFISKGRHIALWNGTDDSGNPVPSGTYMCRVILGNEIATSKITLLK